MKQSYRVFFWVFVDIFDGFTLVWYRNPDVLGNLVEDLADCSVELCLELVASNRLHLKDIPYNWQ